MASAETKCPLCMSENCEVVYDLSVAQSSFDVPGLVLRCRDCSLWFKRLSGEDGVPTAYIGEYGDDDVAQTYLLGESARRFFREALVGLEAPSGKTGARLLDLGAAQGALLEEAARLGFDAEGVDHCEPNVQVARAKGLRVRLASAEDLDEQERFDVVTMLDLIEHVEDPMRLLGAARRALKPGGALVVYTPNHRAGVVVLARFLEGLGIRYPVREIFGRNHLCFFDDRSLPLALDRAGFEVTSRRLFPYDASRPGQHVSAANLAAVALVEWLGKPFGRVFRMLVYARKRG